jgi:hypothetical protein
LLKSDGAQQYCVTIEPLVADVGQANPLLIRAYHPAGLTELRFVAENDFQGAQAFQCGGATSCTFAPSFVQDYEGQTLFSAFPRKTGNIIIGGVDQSITFSCPGEYCPPDPGVLDFTSWMRSNSYEECVTSFYHSKSLDGASKSWQKFFLRGRLAKEPIVQPYVVHFYDIISTDSGGSNIPLGQGQGGNCIKYNLWQKFCSKPVAADYLFVEKHFERSYGLDFTFVYHAVPTSYTQQFNLRLSSSGTSYIYDAPPSSPYYNQFETHSIIHFALETVNGLSAVGAGNIAGRVAILGSEPRTAPGMGGYTHEWGHTWAWPHNFYSDPSIFFALDGVMDNSYRADTSLIDPTDPLERYALEPIPGTYVDAGTFAINYSDAIAGTSQLPTCGTVDPAITGVSVASSSATSYTFELTLANLGAIPVGNVRLAAENNAQPGVLLADRVMGSLNPGESKLHRVTIPTSSLQAPSILFTLDRPDEIAEALESNNQVSVPLCFDVDQDGWTTCEGDCNDNEARINGHESTAVYATCFDALDNDCDGTADWDCAVDVGNERVILGTVSGGLASMRAASADDVYESLKESNSGKRLNVVWSFPNVSPQTWYDLRVEGFRNFATGDSFNFEWTTKDMANGLCDGSEAYLPALAVSKITDDDRLQLFQLGPPPAGSGGVQFCVRVQDSNTAGSDNKADTLKLDKLYVFPILIDARAQDEFTTVGSRLNGTSFVQTQADDGVFEVLQEGGADALSHTWIFDAPLGFTHRLYLDATRTNSTDLDDFQFYFATAQPGVTPEQPGEFQIIPGALVDQARGGVIGEFPFATENYAGTVWIRVLDTVPNGATLDRLSIDYLAVRATP